MTKELADTIDRYVQSGAKPAQAQNNCPHWELERVTFEARLPVIANEPFITWLPFEVERCRECGVFLPANPNSHVSRVVVQVIPEAEKVICFCVGCGLPLSQPYARAMGECISCCLKRLRSDRGRGFMVGYRPKTKKVYGTEDPEKIEKLRAYNREYYREYRRMRRAQGLT